MNKRRYLALLLVAVFTIGTILVPERTTYAAKKTQLNKKSVTIEIGKTVTLKLKNAPKGKKIKWTSSKKKVAVVNSKGRVQGKSAGKAKITAKVGKKKYTCTVTVKKKEKLQQVTTEAPTTQTVTEAPTTTEATTEAPATEKAVMPDMSKYGTMEKVTVNGEEYNILNVTDAQKYSDDIEFSKQDLNVTCSKMFVSDFGYDSMICEYNENHKYLEFFGKINIVDEYGVDCSNNIFIVEKVTKKKFYYVNSRGEFRYIASCNMVSFDFLKEFGTYTYIDEVNKICINGTTYQ